MAIPSHATSVHLDSGSDDPVQARAEIAALVGIVNQLIDHVATLPTLANVGTAATKNVGAADGEVPTNVMLASGAKTAVGSGPTEIPLNQHLGAAARVDTGTGADQVPLNSQLGTAAVADLGTAPGQVVVSDDLGSAAAADTGTGAGDVPVFDANGALFGADFDDVSLFKIGTWSFWIDPDGNLRVKDGVPNGATEGDLVGLQAPPLIGP